MNIFLPLMFATSHNRKTILINLMCRPPKKNRPGQAKKKLKVRIAKQTISLTEKKNEIYTNFDANLIY